MEWQGADDLRVGYVNYEPDLDQRVRSAQFYWSFFERSDSPVYHSLAMAALKQLKMESQVPYSLESRHFRFMPLRKVGGRPNPYEPIPFYTIFLKEFWEKNYGSGEFFKDKIVYVGGTSIPYFHDVVDTPEGEILGPHLQMNVLGAALEGEFYSKGGLLEMLGMSLSVDCSHSSLHSFSTVPCSDWPPSLAS